MCGRYTSTVVDPEILAQAFNLSAVPTDLRPRYNVAPTQQVSTIVQDSNQQNQHVWMRWGLIPSWAKERQIGNRMINARAETLAEKPSFRTAYQRRRCLVVADGFYEWKKNESGPKTPIYIRMNDGSIFGMAGLWERWRDPETGELLTTCTIITTEPNELVKPFHHRMAVILPNDAYDHWLDPRVDDTQALQPLLQPYPADQMEAYTVSMKVNNPANDSPDLLDRVDG